MVHVLIKNGSNHNFTWEKTISQLGLIKTHNKPFPIVISNEGYMSCRQKCSEISQKIQDHQFQVDLFVLESKGVDSMLGMQWLKHQA